MNNVAMLASFAALSLPDANPLPHAAANKNEIDAVLGIAFSIIGAVSLLVIVIAGFRYVISQDDPQAVSRAKNAILYATIGLAVAILAVSIVSFVAGSLQ